MGGNLLIMILGAVDLSVQSISVVLSRFLLAHLIRSFRPGIELIKLRVHVTII